MKFGFGQSNSGNNANGPADMTVTGEGCESLSEMGWKKKENKFQGNNSLSEREFKEKRELDNKAKVDQYISKFPPNENYLGFENVSVFLSFLMFFIVGFQYLLCQFCDIGFVSLQAFQIPSSIMEASKHSKILFDKRASRFIQIHDQRQRIQRCNEPQKIYFQDKSRKTAIQQR